MLAGAVLECLLDKAFFEEIFPGVLIVVFEVGVFDLVLLAENKDVLLVDVENALSDLHFVGEVLVEDNILGDAREDGEVLWIDKDNMELRNHKSHWTLLRDHLGLLVHLHHVVNNIQLLLGDIPCRHFILP